MKRSLIVVPLVVVVAAAAILFLGGPTREFTTTSPEAYEAYQRGFGHIMAFQFALAESSLTRATSLDPAFAMARAQLAVVYHRDWRRKLAEEQKVIADSLSWLLPNEVEKAKIQLVLCGLKDQHTVRRDSILDFLVAEDPDNLLVLTAHGSSLYQRDNVKAREIFEEILAIEPNNAPAYNMLGYMAAAEGDFETAQAHLRKYMFLAPDLANPHDSLGQILSWMGEYEESEREYRTALNIEPDFYFSLLGLANIYLEQGMLKKGGDIIAQLRPHISGTPVEKQIDQKMIQILYTYELYEESYAGIASFIERYPDDNATPFYRAIHAGIEDRFDDADAIMAAFLEDSRMKAGMSGSAEYMRAVESFPHQYAAIIASFQERHADAADAWSRFREAREQDIDYQERWWELWRESESRLAAGEPGMALPLAMKALDPNPRRIRPLLVIARAALDLNQLEVARTAADQLGPLMAKADDNLPPQSTYREVLARLQVVNTD